jgi:hypothetical protein
MNINNIKDIVKNVLKNKNLDEATEKEVQNQQELNKELEKTKNISKELEDILKEDSEWDDSEPKNSDIKDDDLSFIHYSLQQNNKFMKNVLKKYKESSGEEKEQYKEKLKQLTKIKKELEGLLL